MTIITSSILDARNIKTVRLLWFHTSPRSCLIISRCRYFPGYVGSNADIYFQNWMLEFFPVGWENHWICLCLATSFYYHSFEVLYLQSSSISGQFFLLVWKIVKLRLFNCFFTQICQLLLSFIRGFMSPILIHLRSVLFACVGILLNVFNWLVKYHELQIIILPWRHL